MMTLRESSSRLSQQSLSGGFITTQLLWASSSPTTNWGTVLLGGVCAWFVADWIYEVVAGGIVRPTLKHAPAAKPVADVAREVGAAAPFRHAFDRVGSYVSRFAHTLAYGVSYGARRDLRVSLVDRWTTPDGGTLELVWLAPRCRVEEEEEEENDVENDFENDDFDDDAPVVVSPRDDSSEDSDNKAKIVGAALILPGLGGDASGAHLAAESCLKAGLQPIILHRRGDGVRLTSPKFNIFGDVADLDAAIKRIRETLAVGSRAKKNNALLPVAIFASSAGTGLLVRWLGERGDDAPICAAFANCPGFDISVALARCSYAFDVLYYARKLKTHYLLPNRALLEPFDPAAFNKCLKAPTAHAFMAAAAPFAGFRTFGEYLIACNPMGTAHLITTPLLVVNALDDPVCVRANLDDHDALFEVAPSAVSVRTSRGGHCAFFAKDFVSYSDDDDDVEQPSAANVAQHQGAPRGPVQGSSLKHTKTSRRALHDVDNVPAGNKNPRNADSSTSSSSSQNQNHHRGRQQGRHGGASPVVVRIYPWAHDLGARFLAAYCARHPPVPSS